MSGWLEALEAIDKSSIFSLSLIVLAAIFFCSIIYLLWGRRALWQQSEQAPDSTANATRRNLLRSVNEVHVRWSSVRGYPVVLQQGPSPDGNFAGWFADEIKICSQFKNVIERLDIPAEARYPVVAQEYLKIVSEQDRQPEPVWAWLMLVVLIAAEAYGLSILLAGYLNDTGTASQDNWLAIGICSTLSIVLLSFAHAVGIQNYKHGYARNAWNLAGRQLSRDPRPNKDGGPVGDAGTLDLTAEDNIRDQFQAASIRIANRSDYVNSFIAKTKGDSRNNNARPFTSMFWVYVGIIIAFGLAILTFRISAINANYAQEMVRMQQLSRSESPSVLQSNGPARPKAIDGLNNAANQDVTQESIERTKSTKVVVTIFYIMLFWMVQALAVIIADRFGFASSKGRLAYNLVRSFGRKFGEGLMKEEFEARMRNELAHAKTEARAVASSTLQAWQLGLHAEYKNSNPSSDKDDRDLIEKALSENSQRTFPRFLKLSHMDDEPIANSAAISNASATQPRSSVAVPGPAAVALPTADSLIEYRDDSHATVAVVRTDVKVGDLQLMVGVGDLESSSIHIRLAGTSDEFVPYRQFMKRLRKVEG